MLLRMYLRWAARHGFGTEVASATTEGEQTGIKSATVTVDGRFAYGWLRPERGVHWLVRISPYDAQKRRQTTFGLVEVMPEVDDDAAIEPRLGRDRRRQLPLVGAGGQHVQKTNSAVLTHRPTGIVVAIQNERSATQNRQTAEEGADGAAAGATARGEGSGARGSAASTWRPAGATIRATCCTPTRWSRT